MLLVICVDSDDDIGKKTGVTAPIVGRKEVEEVAMKFGTSDPEDSDLNALFEAMRVYDEEEGEKEIVVLTGNAASHRRVDREVAKQLDEIIERYEPDSAIICTDGAEDEGIIPIIESRMKIDGVNRTVVRQAENLENAYMVIKQLLRDPETRGTILIPLGILLLIYPVNILFSYLNYPNAALGLATAALGAYFLVKGFELDDTIEEYSERARDGIYSGKVSLITYLIAAGLIIIGFATGFRSVQMYTASPDTTPVGAVRMASVFLSGSIFWLTIGAVISSIGRILDEYIQGEGFNRSYLNGPFYITSMGLALYGVSEFYLGDVSDLYLAAVIVISIGIGATSTAIFGGFRGAAINEREDATSDEVPEVE